MNLGIVALGVLLIVIVLSFVLKVNVGLLAIAGAVILGLFADIPASDIIGGFSSSLFLMMLGVTFLVAVAMSNGSLELLSKKLLSLAGGRAIFAPILLYVIGFGVAAIGPGCVPALGIVSALAIPLGKSTRYNPIMLALIGQIASFSGRFSPLTPESALFREILEPQGVTGWEMPLLIYTLVTTLVLAVMVFFIFKGHKVNAKMEEMEELPQFTREQITTLLGFVVMILVVVLLGVNVGLISFTVGILLILLGVADESKVFQTVSWSTLIMVTGVGMLMGIVIDNGGIEILSNLLVSIMSTTTAAPIQGVIAGILSWFSSAIGVVWPTLLPTVNAVSTQVGVDPVSLVTIMGLTASFAGLSPASTGGGLIMASMSTDPDFTKEDGNKLFIQLFGISILMIVIITIISLLGVYTIL